MFHQYIVFITIFSISLIDGIKVQTTNAMKHHKRQPCLSILIEDIHSDQWKLNQAVEILNNGGVGIIPTDTCYSFVTSMTNKEGILRILSLKNEGMKKPLSVICSDIASISKYSTNLCDQKWVYKLFKTTLPGPYTYILPSSKEVPSFIVDHKKHMRRWKRKEIGVRIPFDPVCSYLTSHLLEPLISGSVPEFGEDLDINVLLMNTDSDQDDDEDDDSMSSFDGSSHAQQVDGTHDEWMLRWGKQIDFIVEFGSRGSSSSNDDGRSTVIDLTSGEAVLLRQGVGVYPPSL